MRIALLILICFAPDFIFGQKNSREFFDKSDNPTDSAKSYYYSEHHKGESRDSLSQSKGQQDTVFNYFTATRKIKARHIYLNKKLNGPFVNYHPNGRVHEKGIYRDGYLVGYLMTWYPEGIPEKTLIYRNGKPFNPDYINYSDSSGVALVKNGEGFCKCLDRLGDGGVLKVVGIVRRGLKDSIWSGYANDTLVFEENYKAGEFLWGIWHSKTKEYSYLDGARPFASAVEMGDNVYTIVESAPEFPGGLEAMYKFVQKSMKYPAQARRMGTEGKVFVSFIVGADGVLDEFGIVKGVTIELNAEALRVVKLMPPWTPGHQRGRAVRVKYVMPINFKLAD